MDKNKNNNRLLSRFQNFIAYNILSVKVKFRSITYPKYIVF